MAGTAVSELIFFIAALLISASVAGVFITIVDEYAEDLEDEASLLKQDMRSSLKVINDQKAVPYENSSGNLTFYLKNVGLGELSTADIVVSANGTTSAGDDIKVKVVGGSEWSPGRVVEVIFKVSGMKEGVDYHGWASTSGISEKGVIRGHTQDMIVFRIEGG